MTNKTHEDIMELLKTVPGVKEHLDNHVDDEEKIKFLNSIIFKID